MRTLHVGLRVSDLERSLAFYTAVGYTVVGTVEGTEFGSLTMLRLPGDEFVALELVHDPAKGAVDLGTGINHLVIQTESLDVTVADLAANGVVAEPPERPGRRPAGSPTRTATGSNWSSGRPATLTA
jgi:lactoylglutathione lyase